MSSSVQIDSKNKNILVLDEESRKGLDVSTLTAAAKYPKNTCIINFTNIEQKKIFITISRHK